MQSWANISISQHVWPRPTKHVVLLHETNQTCSSILTVDIPKLDCEQYNNKESISNVSHVLRCINFSLETKTINLSWGFSDDSIQIWEHTVILLSLDVNYTFQEQKWFIFKQRPTQNPFKQLRLSFWGKNLTAESHNYFHKKLHLRCLTWFWIRLSFSLRDITDQRILKLVGW